MRLLRFTALEQAVFFKTFLAGVLLSISVAAEPLLVVATTGMIADGVKEIGGSEVTVQSLMGPGVDPHLYKASHGNMRQLRQADVIFFNGLHLEGKMADVLTALARQKVCVAIAESLSKDELMYPAESHGQPDPHIWFDVTLWKKALGSVAETLSQFAPEKREYFAGNYQEYAKKLTELDTWARSEIESVPRRQRVLLTAHDAFGYFGRAYDIEVLALQGMSTASEFGLFELKKISDTVLQRGIKAIFVETSVPQRFVLALKKGVETRGGKIALGGELYSDAMGVADSGAGNYIGMFTSNVNTIVKSLK